MRALLIIAVVSLAICGASSGVASPDAAPPVLSGKMTQLQYLIGTWSCTTKVPPQGKTAGLTLTAKSVHWIEPGNAVGNHFSSKDYSANGYMGWVPEKKLWWTDFADRYVGTGSETGEDSGTNVQVLTGSYWFQGQATPSRDTLTKNSDTSTDDVFELKTNGRWEVQAASSCSKTSDKTM